jgi:hypothetical protein
MPLGPEGDASTLVTVATKNATLLKGLPQTFEELPDTWQSLFAA